MHQRKFNGTNVVVNVQNVEIREIRRLREHLSQRVDIRVHAILTIRIKTVVTRFVYYRTFRAFVLFLICFFLFFISINIQTTFRI